MVQTVLVQTVLVQTVLQYNPADLSPEESILLGLDKADSATVTAVDHADLARGRVAKHICRRRGQGMVIWKELRAGLEWAGMGWDELG